MRTGWALTAATQRKCGSQGEQTREARLRGLSDCGGGRCARPGIASHREIFCVPTWDRIFELEVMLLKKLLFIIPSVLLLLAAGTLVFCKHHAERTGLACMDIDL